MNRYSTFRYILPQLGMSLFFIALGAWATWNVHRHQISVSEVIANEVEGMVIIHNLYIKMREVRYQLNQYLRFSDTEHLQKIGELEHDTEKLIESARLHTTDAEQMEKLSQVAEGYESFRNQFTAVKQLGNEEKNSMLKHLADSQIDALILDPAQECVRQHEENVERTNNSYRGTSRRLIQGFFWLGITGCVAGVLFGWAIARGLQRSLWEMHLSVTGTVDKLDEVIGPFQTSSNTAPDALRSGLTEIERRVTHVVAQLHEREKELLHNEQLASMGKLAAALAHEMRNPLTPMKMLVQLASTRTSGPGLDARELQILAEEIERLERAIQTFLDFARPPTLEKRTADLCVTLHDSVKLISGRCRSQDIQLVTNFPNEPCWIQFDATQIKQLLLNLLLNALDELKAKGKIVVAIHRSLDRPPQGKRNAAERSRPGILLVVSDNGPGIPTESLEKIFEPFATYKEHGTGLGLAICRRIVEAHGGTIAARNGALGGAEFVVWLPLDTQVSSSPSNLSPPALLKEPS